jgi:putative Holliday junction resolvase
VGVAISDPTQSIAQSLPFLPATPFSRLLKNIRELLQSREVVLVLVGVPRNMDGSHGPSSTDAQDFARHLGQTLMVRVETMDERLTTVQASRELHECGKSALKQKQLIDSASARVLLQSYLDSKTLGI